MEIPILRSPEPKEVLYKNVVVYVAYVVLVVV